MYIILSSHQFQSTAATYVASFAGVAGFFSLICNVVALYFVNHAKFSFREFNRHMIVIAAVGDIVSSTSALSMGVPYAILGYPGIYESGWYCNIFQSTLNFSTIVSWTAVSLIAVDRFLTVFTLHSVGSRGGWLVLILVSALFFVINIVNIFNGQFMPDPTDSHCWYYDYFIVPYLSTIMTSIVFTFCFIIITVSYISVAYYCYRKSAETDSIFLRNALKRCIFILFLYYTCLGPKVLSTIWTHFSPETHPFVLDIITPIGLAFSMVVNPLLILGLHTRFRTQLVNLVPSHKL